MTEVTERILANKRAIRIFVELLEKNPGKYVLVMEDGRTLVTGSESEALGLIEREKAKNFYFAHWPAKEVERFVF